MSDYTGRTRTNYFSVTDVEKFKHVISSCRASDEIIIFDEEQEDGSLKFGFYCFGEIHGLPDESFADAEVEDDDVDTDYNYDAFSCEAGILYVAFIYRAKRVLRNVEVLFESRLRSDC